MHEVLVNRLGGLSLPRKSVVRLTDRPDMTLDVYRGRKTTIQQQQSILDKINTSEDNNITSMLIVREIRHNFMVLFRFCIYHRSLPLINKNI